MPIRILATRIRILASLRIPRVAFAPPCATYDSIERDRHPSRSSDMGGPRASHTLGSSAATKQVLIAHLRGSELCPAHSPAAHNAQAILSSHLSSSAIPLPRYPRSPLPSMLRSCRARPPQDEQRSPAARALRPCARCQAAVRWRSNPRVAVRQAGRRAVVPRSPLSATPQLSLSLSLCGSRLTRGTRRRSTR